MYGYYIGEIFKKVYEDWPKYNDNPKFVLLTEHFGMKNERRKSS